MQVIGLVRFIVFLAYMPLFVLLTVLPVGVLQRFAAQLMLWLFSVYSIDDKNFINSINKSKPSEGKIILSNQLCFLDVFYYFLRYTSDDF